MQYVQCFWLNMIKHNHCPNQLFSTCHAKKLLLIQDLTDLFTKNAIQDQCYGLGDWEQQIPKKCDLKRLGCSEILRCISIVQQKVWTQVVCKPDGRFVFSPLHIQHSNMARIIMKCNFRQPTEQLTPFPKLPGIPIINHQSCDFVLSYMLEL